MKNQIPASIKHNLLFLITQVSLQVASLQSYLQLPATTHATQVSERGQYMLTLSLRIHQDSHLLCTDDKTNKIRTFVFRAVNVIANNLERIATLCCDCLTQAAKLKNPQVLPANEIKLLLDKIISAIQLIGKAICQSNPTLALAIHTTGQEIKQSCAILMQNYMNALKNQDFVEDLVNALLVVHGIEQITEALLACSEALVSGHLGQAVNIERYHALNTFVKQLNQQHKKQQWLIKTAAPTRSGCTVSELRKSKRPETVVAIFKDGKKRKLNEERERVAAWHQIYPGIAPKILSYNSQGDSAALLIEHLQGLTFESVLLHESYKIQKLALQQLCLTLKSIWQSTQRQKSVNAHYIKQLQQRLPEVYALHPQFKQATAQIGAVTFLDFEELLIQTQGYEAQLKTHFSVYIHGDFNSDNIIFDPATNKINFIDLHRSCYMDYVQDVSVFIVSNYRLQPFNPALKQQIFSLMYAFYEFVANFAKDNNDSSFELRLALGLARSFASSTRFILDKTLAQAMFLRARYLIEQVLRALETQQIETYQLPLANILQFF